MATFSNSDPYLAIERALRAARKPADEGPRSRQMWDQYQADREPYGNRPWRPTPYEPTPADVEAVAEALDVDLETAAEIVVASQGGGSAPTAQEDAGWVNHGVVLGLLQNHADVLGKNFSNIGKDIGFGYRGADAQKTALSPAAPPRTDALPSPPVSLPAPPALDNLAQALAMQDLGGRLGEAQMAAADYSPRGLSDTDETDSAAAALANAQMGAQERGEQAALAAMEQQARLDRMFNQEESLLDQLPALAIAPPAQDVGSGRTAGFASRGLGQSFVNADEFSVPAADFEAAAIANAIASAQQQAAISAAIADAMAQNESAMAAPGQVGYGSQNDSAVAGYGFGSQNEGTTPGFGYGSQNESPAASFGYGSQNDAPDAVVSPPSPVAAVRGLTGEPNISAPVSRAQIADALSRALSRDMAEDVSRSEEGNIGSGVDADARAAIDRALAVARLNDLQALQDMDAPSRSVQPNDVSNVSEAGIPSRGFSPNSVVGVTEFGVPGPSFIGRSAVQELEAALEQEQSPNAVRVVDVSRGRTGAGSANRLRNVDTIVAHDENPGRGRNSAGDNINGYHITFDENGVYVHNNMMNGSWHATKNFAQNSISVGRRGNTYTDDVDATKIPPQGLPGKVRGLSPAEQRNAAIAMGMAMAITGLGPESVRTHPQLGKEGTRDSRPADEGSWAAQAARDYLNNKDQIDRALNQNQAFQQQQANFRNRSNANAKDKQNEAKPDVKDRTFLPPRSDRQSSVDGLGRILADLLGISSAAAAPGTGQGRSGSDPEGTDSVSGPVSAPAVTGIGLGGLGGIGRGEGVGAGLGASGLAGIGGGTGGVEGPGALGGLPGLGLGGDNGTNGIAGNIGETGAVAGLGAIPGAIGDGLGPGTVGSPGTPGGGGSSGGGNAGSVASNQGMSSTSATSQESAPSPAAQAAAAQAVASAAQAAVAAAAQQAAQQDQDESKSEDSQSTAAQNDKSDAQQSEVSDFDVVSFNALPADVQAAFSNQAANMSISDVTGIKGDMAFGTDLAPSLFGNSPVGYSAVIGAYQNFNDQDEAQQEALIDDALSQPNWQDALQSEMTFSSPNAFGASVTHGNVTTNPNDLSSLTAQALASFMTDVDVSQDADEDAVNEAFAAPMSFAPASLGIAATEGFSPPGSFRSSQDIGMDQDFGMNQDVGSQFGGVGLGADAMNTSLGQMSALGLSDIGFSAPAFADYSDSVVSSSFSSDDSDGDQSSDAAPSFGGAGIGDAASATAASAVGDSTSATGESSDGASGTSGGGSSDGFGGGFGDPGSIGDMSTSIGADGIGVSDGGVGGVGGDSGGGDGGGDGGGGGGGGGDGGSDGGPAWRGGYIDEPDWTWFERDQYVRRALRAAERLYERDRKASGGYVMPFARFANGGEIVENSVEYTPNGVIYSQVVQRALNAAKRRNAA